MSQGGKILKSIKILRIFLSVGHPRDPKGEGLLWVEKDYKSLKRMLKTSQTTLKKLRQSPENDFFDPKNGQIWDVNLAKSVDFRVHCRPPSSIFGLLVL